MDGEQKSPHDVTINNIMIMSHVKPEICNSESIPSSVASGSSDQISALSKSDILQTEINKEIDKLFGPALERTRSGSEIEVTAPLRQRKRQYRSQEVLFPDLSLTETQGSGSSDTGLNILYNKELKNVDDEKIKQVSILYDNQRAEIVASVTERLYNKLKRNEKVISKMESVVDKKIMQPLSELKICSNARQRLVELSQKAIKNKRKIGIPAYTQTKKYATRVKDQEVDIQTDLEPYIKHSQNHICILQKDVGTETDSITSRYKDIAVGSKYSSLSVTDQYTLTVNKMKSYKNSFTMTDDAVTRDCSTQTCVIPPPRRKKRTSAISKYLKKSDTLRSIINDKSSSPVININISPVYPVDSESSGENSEGSYTPTPAIVKETNKYETNSMELKPTGTNKKIQNKIDDFSDDDEISVLPRMSLDPNRKGDCKDYEDMILGRDIFPYNVILSPSKNVHESTRIIKFKDIDITPAECGSEQWLEKKNENFDFSNSGDQCINFKPSGSNSIDTAELQNIEADSTSFFKSCLKKSRTMNNNLQNGYSESTIGPKIKNHERNGCVRYSLSQIEMTSSGTKGAHNSIINKNLIKFENNLDNRSRSLHFLINKNKLGEPNVCETNNYKHNKLTPTEYLKQLINIRRDAVASNYRKRFHNSDEHNN